MRQPRVLERGFDVHAALHGVREERLDEVSALLGQIAGREERRLRPLALADAGQSLTVVATTERRHAREEEQRDHTKRPHVSSHVHTVTVSNFGSNELGHA